MGGGTLQLVTKGIETIYLTDNPEITFFKNIYRRYTNFSLFEHDLHFKAKFGFGNTNTVKIRNIADILYGLGLYIKLPDINLKFKDPIISNLKEIFEKFQIKFNNIDNLNKNSTLTTDIFNNHFISQIENEQIKQIDTYNVNDNNLEILNNNYEMLPNVFEGEYKILDKKAIDHNLIAIDSSAINYIPENNSFTELYYLINIVDDTGNIILINNIIKEKTPNQIILSENDELLTFNSKYLNYISIDSQENFEEVNNTNWINLQNSLDKSSFKYKYIAISKEKLPSDLTQVTNLSISPNSIIDTNGKIVLFEKPFNNEYYLVDTTGSNLDTNFITVQANDGNILKDGLNKKSFTKNFLDEFSVTEGTHDYIAVKINNIPDTITDDFELDLLDPNTEDNNYFIVNGTGKDLINDSIEFSQSDIIKTNEDNPEIKYFTKTFIENYSITNLVIDDDYYFVNVGEDFDQTLTQITFNQNDIYKNSNEIIYFKQDFLDNYTIPSGSHTLIPIKKSTLNSNPYFSGDLTINIENNSIKNNNNEYILFPELDKTSGNLEPKYIAIKRRNLSNPEFTNNLIIQNLASKSYTGDTVNIIKFDNLIENYGNKLTEIFSEKNSLVGYSRHSINFIKFPNTLNESKSKNFSKILFNNLKKDTNNTIELYNHKTFTNNNETQYLFINNTNLDYNISNISDPPDEQEIKISDIYKIDSNILYITQSYLDNNKNTIISNYSNTEKKYFAIKRTSILNTSDNNVSISISTSTCYEGNNNDIMTFPEPINLNSIQNLDDGKLYALLDIKKLQNKFESTEPLIINLKSNIFLKNNNLENDLLFVNKSDLDNNNIIVSKDNFKSFNIFSDNSNNEKKDKYFIVDVDGKDISSNYITFDQSDITKNTNSEIIYFTHSYLDNFIFQDNYFLVDITGKDLSLNTITFNQDDIYKNDSNKIIFFTEEILNNKTHDSSNLRIAIKKKSLTDLDFTGDININLLEDSNGFKGSSTDFILFEDLDKDEGNLEYSRIAIKRSNLLNPNFENNITIDLLDENIIDTNYFLVDINSSTLTGDSLEFSQNDIMKNNSEILYFKQEFLENYFFDTGDVKYIAIKRKSLQNLNFTTTTTIDLSNNVGFKNYTSNYIKFPTTISNFGLKISDLFKSSVGFKGKINNYIKFPNLSDNNGLDISKSITEKYLYEESVEEENISESSSNDNSFILVKKNSLTTVNSGGIDSYSFTRDNIFKISNSIQYNQYTNNITRVNTIIDKNINKDVNAKYDSNQIRNISFNLNNSISRQPLIFPVRFYSQLIDTTLSDQNKVTKILIEFLISLLDDIYENSSRNIKLDQLNQIKTSLYIGYINRIFIGNDSHNSALTEKFKKFYGDISGIDLYYTNSENTFTSSNFEIIKSFNKNNILFIHLLDNEITNYYGIPIKSNLINDYFEYLFNSYYFNSSEYTSLDAYQIYYNYVNLLNNLNINLISNSGYYDNSTILTKSIDIITSILINLRINNLILIEIINILNNIYTISDLNILPENPIHFSSVFTYNSNSSPFLLSHFGNIDNNLDDRNKSNIIEDMIKISETDSSVTKIFYDAYIKENFNTLLDSSRKIFDNNTLKYFNDIKLWNNLFIEPIIDNYTDDTSLALTLKIADTGTNTKFNNYKSIFGTNTHRSILNHIPYALIMNIPYVISKIILNGSLLNENSTKFGFSDRLTLNKSDVKKKLYQYLNLEYHISSFTGQDDYKNFLNVHKGGTDGSTDVDKTTSYLSSLEQTVYSLVIGDSTSFYNRTYYNSLKNASDTSDFLYIVSAFTIEKIINLSKNQYYSRTDNYFTDLNNLTAIDYVINSFKQIYKEILNDFIDAINNNTITGLNLTDVTDDGLGNLDFSFVEKIYNEIVVVLDTFNSEKNIISFENYINNNSIYNDTSIFTKLITDKTGHNYKFLDIHSMIWNKYQKINIRSFNEFLYNGIFNLDTIKNVGGINLESHYHRIINKLYNLIDNDSNINTADIFYNEEYTDDKGNTYFENLNLNFNEYSPVGNTGIDFYRIRYYNNSEYFKLKDILYNDNNYFDFLYNTRYENLKSILNIKNLNMDKKKYTYNTAETIIKDISVKLIDNYNINNLNNSSELINIIGYEQGQDNFVETAEEVYNNSNVVIDIIKRSDSNVIDITANPLKYDNITAKLTLASTALLDPLKPNPYDNITENNLYSWFENNKNDLNTLLVSSLYDNIKLIITPELLFEETNKVAYFNSYYGDVILFTIFITFFTVPNLEFIKTFQLSTTSEEIIFNSFITFFNLNKNLSKQKLLTIASEATDEHYIIVDITGKDLSTNEITIDQDDIKKNDTNILYYSLNYLDKYIIPSGNHTRIAIKKSALTDENFTGDLTINLLENSNGYTKNSTEYIKFPDFSNDDGVTNIKFIQNNFYDYNNSNIKLEIDRLLTTDKPNFNWVKELGFRIIESVSISIGDQEIETHSSELLSHISRIHTPYEQLRGLNTMIGNIPEMYTSSSNNERLVNSLFIPFKFWFCKHVGNGLPLISLLHTDVNLKIKLRNIDEVLIKDDGAIFTKIPKIETKLIGNFIYLDEEERSLVAKSRLEFLIERYLYSGTKIISKNNLFNNRIKNELHFQDPSKYIYWKFNIKDLKKEDDKTNWNKGNFTLTDENGNKSEIKSFDLLKLKFNGRTRESFKEYGFYNYYHPYLRGFKNIEAGEFVYSFALNPLEYQPSGSANLSYIDDFTLIAQLPQELVQLLKESKIIIEWKTWSCSINILVCQSGMSALRFFG